MLYSAPASPEQGRSIFETLSVQMLIHRSQQILLWIARVLPEHNAGDMPFFNVLALVFYGFLVIERYELPGFCIPIDKTFSL